MTHSDDDILKVFELLLAKSIWLQQFLVNYTVAKGSTKRVLARLGRGGGLVVSVLAFYSHDPSLNPAGYLNFLCGKTKMNKKEARVGPSLKNRVQARWVQI